MAGKKKTTRKRKKAVKVTEPVTVVAEATLVPEVETPAVARAFTDVAKPNRIHTLIIDFPCEESARLGAELHEKYGEAFTKLVSKVGGAIPISYLRKVIEPTLRGKPPKLKAHGSFKDRVKEA